MPGPAWKALTQFLRRDSGQRSMGKWLEQIAAQQRDLRPVSDARVQETFLALEGAFRTKPSRADQCQAMACVCEAARRAIGLQPYPVQIQAGLTMVQGHLAEMATGEGKTLTAVFPACLRALRREGVHVTTVNAYLAQRDHQLMRPIYSYLGLTSANLPEKAPPPAKRQCYQADITYGTGYEFGFDFLRDQLSQLGNRQKRLGKQFLQNLMGLESDGAQPSIQRPLASAIIDEMDSVLLDEAVTPLILSRTATTQDNPDAALYQQAHALARSLHADQHYTREGSSRDVRLTNEGLSLVYAPNRKPASAQPRRPWHEYVENALRAILLYQRDIQYMVHRGAIEIIDENTGRRFPDRKWRGGLHQAVEAKENVAVTPETESQVAISRQRFYRLYPFLCGMTGTAREEEEEIRQSYRLSVVPIPLHRPSQRKVSPDRIFLTRRAKHLAILQAVKAAHRRGQPVLIGTRNVRQSENLARLFRQSHLPFALLNARQDAEEAAIIARSGLAGNITIATNMAGRGADIPLGPGVAENGGLLVIGEERNEARRIDRQLIGRCARQGEPGEAIFFLSYDDDLAKDLTRPDPPADGSREFPAAAARPFFHAQRAREQEKRQQRAQVMRKDLWLDQLKENL